ncbi:DNA repair protein RAD51 homolog 2 [Linum grandiflorum]
MANNLISNMGLPNSIANVFAARNLTTAKDALSLPEFDLMELLDVGLAEVISAVESISEAVSPPHQTALLLMQQRLNGEHCAGHLPTGLKGLDDALCGGIPFGVLTELVGPAGIGKTQFCLKISLLAAMPMPYGGLDAHVIYVDVESKFSSRRMLEIGATCFPEIFKMKTMAKEMAGRILVLRPGSLSEFTESLEQIQVSVLQGKVKLLVIDSMTALVSGESDQRGPRNHALGSHISFLKSLAEFSRIPVVVTNQVRSQSRDGVCQHNFQDSIHSKALSLDGAELADSHLVAALGVHWAHAVTIRLILEASLGQRFLKVSKSPISPSLAFPFSVESSGILLLDDTGREVSGHEINTIHCQGHNDIILFDGGEMQ